MPSFRLLLHQLNEPTDLTVKVTGNNGIGPTPIPTMASSNSNRSCQEKDLKPGQPRLLTVDNEMVVPVNKVVHVLVTGADVIHSFSVPSFGIKIDAVPGRINETWFKADAKARITASARNCAARTTRSCRSRCAW